MMILGLVAAVLALASLPHWLPSAILRLRTRIFTRINGEEAMAIPGKLVDASRFKQIYSHPAANGRSRGAALSDLFWYWLAPGPEIHQEHIEPGERYDQVARATRRILSISRRAARELCTQCVRRVLHREDISSTKLVRLRDLLMPAWADFYYQLVFGKPSNALARELIVGNANDVVTALKCCGLRHMGRRHRLTQFLVAKLEAGEVPHPLPESLSTKERALYLQGTFFNTAVVQMSEAMVHLLLALAQHQGIQARLAAHPEDERYFDRVIDETLRLYPLFGISHRITSADIALDEETAIPKGTVLCFNHPQFHQVGFEHPDRFDPDRWQHLSAYEANYIPFGVSANRPCPAQGLAPLTMRVAAAEILRHFALYSSASHTRSIPHRGPCVLVPRMGQGNAKVPHLHLVLLRIRDRFEDCWRSLVQLVLGTYMVWDARRLRLCQRYFEAKGSTQPSSKLERPSLAQ
ncbi:MAG TPA: cytochrome P450 [Myxococcaceae bacterium]|nr:cytochrome P450 [Myxococcaceae bacterium]